MIDDCSSATAPTSSADDRLTGFFAGWQACVDIVGRDTIATAERDRAWLEHVAVVPILMGQPNASSDNELATADYVEILASHRVLVHRLAVAMNGESASEQVSLGDIMNQLLVRIEAYKNK